MRIGLTSCMLPVWNARAQRTRTPPFCPGASPNPTLSSDKQIIFAGVCAAHNTLSVYINSDIFQ